MSQEEQFAENLMATVRVGIEKMLVAVAMGRVSSVHMLVEWRTSEVPYGPRFMIREGMPAAALQVDPGDRRLVASVQLDAGAPKLEMYRDWPALLAEEMRNEQ